MLITTKIDGVEKAECRCCHTMQPVAACDYDQDPTILPHRCPHALWCGTHEKTRCFQCRQKPQVTA